MTVFAVIGDSFSFKRIFDDMKQQIPELDNKTAIEILSFWIGGSGIENIDHLRKLNHSYLEALNQLTYRWATVYDEKTFFDMILVCCVI